MKIKFQFPYPLRKAIGFISTRNKRGSSLGAVIKFKEDGIEIYNFNPDTQQANIIYLCANELEKYEFNDSNCNDNDFDSIDELTRLTEIEPLGKESKKLEFPCFLDKVNTIMTDIHKTTPGSEWIIEKYDRYVLKVYINSTKTYLPQSIEYENNEVEKYDFSTYQPTDEVPLHCKICIDQLDTLFTSFAKLKLPRLTIQIVKNGLIFISPSEYERSPEMLGNHDEIEDSTEPAVPWGSVVLLKEQIEAYKGISAIATHSIVKVYFYRCHNPFLAFITHVGFSGYMHIIYPCTLHTI